VTPKKSVVADGPAEGIATKGRCSIKDCTLPICQRCGFCQIVHNKKGIGISLATGNIFCEGFTAEPPKGLGGIMSARSVEPSEADKYWTWHNKKALVRLNRMLATAAKPVESAGPVVQPDDPCKMTDSQYEGYIYGPNRAKWPTNEASQPAPVVVPEIEPAVKLLADVLHLWIDGYISKAPNSMAPDSVSLYTFNEIEKFLDTKRISVDYCGWSLNDEPKEVAPVVVPEIEICRYCRKTWSGHSGEGLECYTGQTFTTRWSPDVEPEKLAPVVVRPEEPRRPGWCLMGPADCLWEMYYRKDADAYMNHLEQQVAKLSAHPTPLPSDQKETFEQWRLSYTHPPIGDLGYQYTTAVEMMLAAWNAAKGGTN
jgi:hypothetical protein